LSPDPVEHVKPATGRLTRPSRALDSACGSENETWQRGEFNKSAEVENVLKDLEEFASGFLVQLYGLALLAGHLPHSAAITVDLHKSPPVPLKAGVRGVNSVVDGVPIHPLSSKDVISAIAPSLRQLVTQFLTLAMEARRATVRARHSDLSLEFLVQLVDSFLYVSKLKLQATIHQIKLMFLGCSKIIRGKFLLQ
jgi:hypothetical protein